MSAQPAEAELRWAERPGELDGALALREQVFVGEQGVPVEMELDGRDEEALHLLALAPGGEHVVGTLRLLFDGDTVKVGRVAVQPGWRRRGIAARMLDVALDESRRRGCRRARLASQLEVVALYERAGFAVESDVFEEAGMPHVWMGRSLDAVA
jgi:predicted GNAT family N-acyltransferase